jgi:hypothetical protein
MAGGITVAAKELARSGRGAGARIEQRNIRFAAAECAVYEWKLTNHGGDKSETEAGFGDDQEARQAGARHNIT